MALETLIFAAIAAAGQIQAGKAEKQEANLNAFNIETDKKLNKVAADQMALERKKEFDFAMSANIAQLAATGRDVGSSMTIKAFLQSQKETAYTDISRIQTQNHWAGLQKDMQRLAEGRRGRNAKTASLYRATATLANGWESYSSAKSTPTGTL